MVRRKRGRGWFGNKKRHSEAAKKGWKKRNGDTGMAKGKRIPKHSGHGDLHRRTLSAAMLNRIKKSGRARITIRGVKKRVTPCNVHSGGYIEWYWRSDTKSIALRNYCSDYSRTSNVKRNRRKRGFEGDTRYVKSKGGYI